MEERLELSINFSAKDASGKETVGNELRLGSMKLSDAKKVEAALLEFVGKLLKHM